MQNQHFLIYKTTNLINGKIYIGKHITRCIDDGYMGSGKRLKHAISKYGIENFVREILHECSSEEEMNAKEAELVTEEFCLRKDTYNLCVGGQGGFSYINRELISSEERVKRGKNGAAVFNNSDMSNKGRETQRQLRESEEYLYNFKSKIRKTKLEKYGTMGTFKGHHHTEDTKEKIRSSNHKTQKISIDNIEYGSITLASKMLNVYASVIRRKLNSNKYPNYKKM